MGGIMAKKRVSRARKRQLETPDEFISFSTRLLEFIIKNKSYVLAFSGAVLIIIAIFPATRYFSIKAENKAFLLLSQSMNKYESMLAATNAGKACLDMENDFNTIINKYSSKTAGKFARVLFANMYFKAGNYDRAIELYTTALKDFSNNQSVKDLILSSLGYAHEEKKDYATAVKYFEMLTKGPDSVLKDEALFNLGRLYSQTGESEKSIEAFQIIVNSYPGSIYYRLAKEKAS